jgi:alpha-ketoglutarate-dependent taurine dioxygenase
MEAIKHFPRVKRRAAPAEPGSWVKLETLGPGGEPPLLIEPAVRGVSLSDWAHANRDLVEERLLRQGALLFRGFELSDAGGFERFIRATSSEWTQYREPATPRSQVSENIYTSTEYPAEHAIFLHNENSHCASWPLKIYFICLVPAASGGETPIADCRKVLSRISPCVRERFIEKNVMYVRNFGDGPGFTWQEVFNTTLQTEVAEYCRRADMDFEWKQDGARLRIRYVRPAVARRPQSGEMVWFNHATFFHISTLEPATRAALLSVLPEEDLPYNTYYGDGSPIEASVMDELRSAYLQETISFPWRRGDVLFLDNMLMAHGRAPYTGARKVLVGMADAVSGDKGD